MKFEMNSITNSAVVKQVIDRIINEFFDSSPNDESQTGPYIFPLFHSPRKVTEISRLFPSNSQ
jgi:hypothetical protein